LCALSETGASLTILSDLPTSHGANLVPNSIAASPIIVDVLTDSLSDLHGG
jgi:hypothetical protein